MSATRKLRLTGHTFINDERIDAEQISIFREKDLGQESRYIFTLELNDRFSTTFTVETDGTVVLGIYDQDDLLCDLPSGLDLEYGTSAYSKKFDEYLTRRLR